jgi:MerR family mercuric resistance operon transcriptional regulator
MNEMMRNCKMKPLTIGQVARNAGVGIETVRFYERQGLLQEPARRESGYRQYPEDVVARLRFIRRAKELGFSLKEIKELLALRVDPDTTCAEVKSRAEAKIADIEEKIQALRRIKKALAKLTAVCRGRGPTSECPILDALDTEGER